jgi:hypothetical protein
MAVEFDKMRKDWHMPAAADYPIVSKELLSNPSSAEEFGEDGRVVRLSLLERMAPDLIVWDESQGGKDPSTVIARTVGAYKKKFPSTIIVTMSGTYLTKAITDASHIMEWCLGDNAPLPEREFDEKMAIASYLDAKKGIGPRAGVGALYDILSPEEKRAFQNAATPDEERSVVRGWWATRILETPGVIGTQDPPLDIGLSIHGLLPPTEDAGIDELFTVLNRWALPDGTECADGMEVARHKNTGGNGVWQKLEPRRGRPRTMGGGAS